jgi:opacity protein-like surface antigen
MKKGLQLAAIIATGILSTVGTISAQKGIQIGVEGTPHLSWMVNKDDQNNTNFEYINTTMGSFGIRGQYGITENVGIGINVVYSFQGQRYKLNKVERIKNVEYLKIPVMFAYNYNINNEFSFFGKIGPQIDLLTNACMANEDGDKIISNHKDAYEDFVISGLAITGLGYKLTENLSIDASVRIDYGFTDAEEKDYNLNINIPNTNGNSGNGSSTKNNRAITNNLTTGLTFGLNYIFPANE